MPAASSAGRLVSPYLQTLARPAPPPGQAFIDTGLDLAASALRAVAGAGDTLDRSRRQLTGELKRYALAHLGDQALTPQAVARANYISVRQLHRLFAREGISFGAWVLEQRLRRCRTDLTDHQLSQRAVAEVATSWGFRSAAHFSRAFTRAMAPQPPAFAGPPNSAPANPSGDQAINGEQHRMTSRLSFPWQASSGARVWLVVPRLL